MFQAAVGNLLQHAKGTPAEAAPLDVYSSKLKVTFSDPDQSFSLPVCLLALCGFTGHLEFARVLIENGASESVVIY